MIFGQRRLKNAGTEVERIAAFVLAGTSVMQETSIFSSMPPSGQDNHVEGASRPTKIAVGTQASPRKNKTCHSRPFLLRWISTSSRITEPIRINARLAGTIGTRAQQVGESYGRAGA